MKSHISSFLASFLLASVLLPAGPSQGQDFTEVEAEDLLENPQNYWAQGIVFRDVLTSPPLRREIQIGSKRYTRLQTQTVGDCYADKRLVPRLEVLDLGREYNFSATVLQQSGFWGSRYFIIIQDAQPAVAATTEVQRRVQVLGHAAAKELEQFQVPQMANLVGDAEQALFAYAQENDLGTMALGDPNSPHYEKAMQIIRATVARAEQELETTSREILTQFIRTILEGPAAPPPGEAERVTEVERIFRETPEAAEPLATQPRGEALMREAGRLDLSAPVGRAPVVTEGEAPVFEEPAGVPEEPIEEMAEPEPMEDIQVETVPYGMEPLAEEEFEPVPAAPEEPTAAAPERKEPSLPPMVAKPMAPGEEAVTWRAPAPEETVMPEEREEPAPGPDLAEPPPSEEPEPPPARSLTLKVVPYDVKVTRELEQRRERAAREPVGYQPQEPPRLMPLPPAEVIEFVPAEPDMEWVPENETGVDAPVGR